MIRLASPPCAAPQMRKYSDTCDFLRKFMERCGYELTARGNLGPQSEMEALMYWMTDEHSQMAREHPEFAMTRDMVMLFKFLTTMESREVRGDGPEGGGPCCAVVAWTCVFGSVVSVSLCCCACCCALLCCHCVDWRCCVHRCARCCVVVPFVCLVQWCVLRDIKAWVHHSKAWVHHLKAWAHHFKGLGTPFKGVGSPFNCMAMVWAQAQGRSAGVVLCCVVVLCVIAH